MKVVVLAGGFGTRISEESHLKPKPMIEIGEKPILWHIMKEYSAYGINEFIICAGYKQHVIKEWFADYFIHTSDITFTIAFFITPLLRYFLNSIYSANVGQFLSFSVAIICSTPYSLSGHGIFNSGSFQRIPPHADGTYLPEH